MSDSENMEDRKPIVIRNTTDLQRLKLEKLMKNPDKQILIPEKPKEKGMPAVPDFVRNVMGSSAGAGSGEFHVYRHLRRKEYARQKYMKEKGEREKLEKEYHDKLEDNKRKLDAKTAKKRAKRQKRKRNLKNKKFKSKDIPKSESSESEDEDESDGDEEQEINVIKEEEKVENNGEALNEEVECEKVEETLEGKEDTSEECTMIEKENTSEECTMVEKEDTKVEKQDANGGCTNENKIEDLEQGDTCVKKDCENK